MTDLPERLRHAAKFIKPTFADDLVEAADEIERLRAALKQLVNDIDSGFPRDEGYDMANKILNEQ